MIRKFSSSTNSLVKTAYQGKICLISICRAEKRNCVNHEIALQLINAFESFENCKEAKIAILYGEGDSFCAGYDLKDVSEGKISTEPDFLPTYRYMGPTAMKLKKPLIAAVEGYAVAGGLELSLLADLRVASEDSVFGVFCRRVGVPLIDGGTVRLPRLIGQSRALDLVLTGRPVSAKEALSMGLVNRIVPKNKTVEYSIKLAKQIISYPYDCLLKDRESVYYSMENSFEDAMLFELNSITVLQDAIKEAGKFVNKKIEPPSKL